MVLSRVVLNLEDAQVRRDLADPYEMHATLMRLVDGGVARPLWRLEVERSGTRAQAILVQTDAPPDPDRLRERSDTYFVHFESRPHRLLDDLRVGELLRFRLRANPTVTRDRKRHGLVRESDQLAWLERILTDRGAEDVLAIVRESARHVMRRRRGGAPIVVHGATFDGVLRVANADELREAIRHGLGHAKALGFGLLTVGR